RRSPRGRRSGSSRARAGTAPCAAPARPRPAPPSRRSRRAGGEGARAAGRGVRGGSWSSGVGAGRPVDDAVLQRREGAVETHGEQEEQQRGGERAGGLE